MLAIIQLKYLFLEPISTFHDCQYPPTPSDPTVLPSLPHHTSVGVLQGPLPQCPGFSPSSPYLGPSLVLLSWGFHKYNSAWCPLLLSPQELSFLKNPFVTVPHSKVYCDLRLMESKPHTLPHISPTFPTPSLAPHTPCTAMGQHAVESYGQTYSVTRGKRLVKDRQAVVRVGAVPCTRCVTLCCYFNLQCLSFPSHENGPNSITCHREMLWGLNG